MRPQGNYQIGFAENCVNISWKGRKAFDILTFLFAHGSECASPQKDPDFILKSTRDNKLALRRKRKLIHKGNSGNTAVILLDMVIHELAKDCKKGLLFHGSALSYNGRGILIPGQSGSGKTILAAWLDNQDYNYLTDEMALVQPEILSLNGFHKPLHIKDRSIPVIKSLISKQDINHPTPPAGSMFVNKGMLLCSNHVNDSVKDDECKIKIVIFPEYKAGAAFQMVRLSKANAGLLLIKNLINARNLKSHGFDQIADLSRNVTAYSLTYSDFEPIVNELYSL